MESGQGYDVDELSNLLTSDHVWAHRVLEQVRQKIMNPHAMRALGSASASSTLSSCREIPPRRNQCSRHLGQQPLDERSQALRDLARGKIQIVFAVDLFNEGVDLPTLTPCFCSDLTESPTLFLQQLGRGLRKSEGKTVCTVLDFVGLHRREFR